jgi:archaemetzincin
MISREPKNVAARLLELGRRPIPITRRQALALLGAGVTVGGLGTLWHINRIYLRSSITLALWLPTPFDREAELSRCRSAADRIRPLFTRKGKPARGEWLAIFDEPGQTLNEYVRSVLPASREIAGAMQILPFGEFDARLTRIVADVVALTELFYGRAVTLLPVEPVPLGPGDRRGNGSGEQLFTTPLLEFLKRRVPAQAPALLGITPMDLTPPEPGWNFVFGQASLVDRVGVWSLYRLANRNAPAEVQFRRVAQVALHELGHMFGLWHCAAYSCGMNGSDTLKESDETPLAFCPECDAKIWWRFRLDPAPRYARLAQFAASRGLARDAELWTRCGQSLKTG